ncbi:MAG TPA: cell division protein SepF [bacterium]|nr:cell division protein SepF [bacterium]
MGRILQRIWTFMGFADAEDGGALHSEALSPGTPVFSLHTQRQMEIVILEPEAFDEAQTAADYLKTHRPIVINLRGAQKDLGKRIVDFLSGVAYALDGHMHRVGDEIFLFTPHHVVIATERFREQMAPGPLFPGG